MKTSVHSVIIPILILLSATCIHAERLVFTFQDAVGDVAGGFFMMDTLSGDVAGGELIIYPETGDYAVTWNAAGNGFQIPLRFKLYLFLSNSGEDDIPVREEMVEISAYWSGAPTTSVTISTFGTDRPPLAGLKGWQAGDSVATYGSYNGVPLVSGIYSLDGEPYDQVSCNGSLIADQDEPVDTDLDGIPDSIDEHGDSDLRETVYLHGINTWIPNRINGSLVSETGHTLADIIQLFELAAAEDYRNHGQYVQELVRNYKMLVKDRLITQQQHYALVRIVVKNKR